MVFKVIVHEDKDGLWAEVPSIRGCFSQGETMEELENNIKEAIEGCLSVDINILKRIMNNIKEYLQFKIFQKI